MTSPTVTIGISSFNASKTIEKCIDSALKQKYVDFEIVIIDDNSEDSSWKKILFLCKSNKKIRAFRNDKNVGVAATRNKIIKKARGQFLAFFDDDDVSQPHRIFSQANKIKAYETYLSGANRLVVCHTTRRVIYPNGKVSVQNSMGELPFEKIPNGKSVASKIITGEYVKNANGSCATCTQMARLSTYKMLGGFDEKFRRSEDTEFAVRLAKLGGHFIGISEELVSQSMTRSNDKSLQKELFYTLLLIQKHKDLAEDNSSYFFCTSWIIMKYKWMNKELFSFFADALKLFIFYPKLTAVRGFLAINNFKINANFKKFYS